MKLLYATSALYPSQLANRAQIRAMAGAFGEALGGDFLLGVPARTELAAPFLLARIPGSLASPLLAWRYALLIRRGSITHIYCREERLFVFMRLFVRLLGLRPRFYFEAHWMRSGIFFRHALRQADGVVAITKGLADDIEKEGVPASRILVAPDGVVLSRYEGLSDKGALRARFGLAPDARVAGYTGSFSQYHDWKGIDTLLAAAGEADDIQFWLVGGEPEEVKRLRSQYPKVRFEGFVASGDIPSIQAACDVLVLPNKKGDALSERYTSPLKLFEYMASGVPMVVSDLPSVREVVSEKESAFAVPGDAASLIAALKSVFADSEAARERASSAKSLVRRYSWSLRARAILDFMTP